MFFQQKCATHVYIQTRNDIALFKRQNYPVVGTNRTIESDRENIEVSPVVET